MAMATLFVLIIIGATAFGGILFEFLTLTNNGSPGAAPKIDRSENEKIVHVSRMKIAGGDYSVWELRDNRTRLLRFMMLVDPVDGRIIRDSEIQRKAFSVRFALQIACLVKSIDDNASRVEEVAANIVRLGNTAIYTAEFVGLKEIAKDLKEFSASIAEKTQIALALAGTVKGSKQYAERLIKDPNEENADIFLASLGASAAVSLSQRAAFVYYIVSSALQQMGSSPGPWLETFYKQVTLETKPTLALLERTFGMYETSVTSTELSAHGVC